MHVAAVDSGSGTEARPDVCWNVSCEALHFWCNVHFSYVDAWSSLVRRLVSWGTMGACHLGQAMRCGR